MIKPQMLYDGDAIHHKVVEMAAAVEAQTKGHDPLFVCLYNGSVMFLADFFRAIRTPVRYEFIQVVFTTDQADAVTQQIQYPLNMDLREKDIVVLRDIVASGVIETYLQTQFMMQGARSVRFVALIDIPAERKTDFVPDHTALTMGRDGVLVGFGLKHRGEYGNLPYLGQIDPAALEENDADSQT